MNNRASSTTSVWTALLVVLALIAVLILPAVRPSIQDRRIDVVNEGPIVVVGMSGVRWEFVSEEETPSILRFANRSSIANLVVKTVGETTCPAAGWLTVNSGARAVAGQQDAVCAAPIDDAVIAETGQIPVETWSAWQEANASNAFDPRLGFLGEELEGLSVLSIGPGAAIATADSDGNVVGAHLAGGDDPSLVFENQVSEGAADITFIDLGAARHPVERAKMSGREVTGADLGEFPERLRAEVRLMDRRFERIVAAAGPDARIMLFSPADSDTDQARLQLFSHSFTAIPRNAPQTSSDPSQSPGEETTPDPDVPVFGENESHPANRGALANSNSTRQAGLVQLTDITPTIVEALGLPESPTVGSSIWAASDSRSVAVTGVYGRIKGLVDAEQKGMTIRAAVVPFYIMWAVAGVAALAVIGLHLWRPRRRPFKLIEFTVASLPISSIIINAVPWWRLPSPTLVLLAGSLGLAVVGGLIATAMNRLRRGAGGALVAAMTATVLAFDAIFGSPLHSPSVLGDQPQSGGRFYGLSNAPFVLFAISMLFLTVFAVGVVIRARREWLALPIVIMMGITAVVVDGSPAIGADFGGLPALIVAYTILVLLVVGKSVRPRTLLWIVLGAIGIALLVTFLDWLRPIDQRSHLGRFFQSIIDGEAARVVGRKIGMLAGSAPPWAWLIVGILAIGLVALLVWLTRTQRWRFSIADLDEFGWGALAVIALVVFGLFINDSGLVLLLVGLLYGVPLWATVALPSDRRKAGQSVTEVFSR